MHQTSQILRRKLQGIADTAATDIDLIVFLCTFLNKSRKLLLHANRSTTTSYVSGHSSDIFYMDHLDGFFTGYFGCQFQVYFFSNGHYKYVVGFALTLGDQSLKGLFDRGTGLFCGMQTVYEFITFLGKQFIWDFILVKNAHSICLYFFCHNINSSHRSDVRNSGWYDQSEQ